MSQLENKAQFWKATCSIDYLLIQTIYDHLGPQRTVENEIHRTFSKHLYMSYLVNQLYFVSHICQENLFYV